MCVPNPVPTTRASRRVVVADQRGRGALPTTLQSAREANSWCLGIVSCSERFSCALGADGASSVRGFVSYGRTGSRQEPSRSPRRAGLTQVRRRVEGAPSNLGHSSQGVRVPCSRRPRPRRNGTQVARAPRLVPRDQACWRSHHRAAPFDLLPRSWPRPSQSRLSLRQTTVHHRQPSLQPTLGAFFYCQSFGS